MESKRYSIKLRADRTLGLFALLILILLSVLGYKRSLDDNESLLLSLLGEKQRLELNSNGIYGVYEDEKFANFREPPEWLQVKKYLDIDVNDPSI